MQLRYLTSTANLQLRKSDGNPFVVYDPQDCLIFIEATHIIGRSLTDTENQYGGRKCNLFEARQYPKVRLFFTARRLNVGHPEALRRLLEDRINASNEAVDAAESGILLNQSLHRSFDLF